MNARAITPSVTSRRFSVKARSPFELVARRDDQPYNGGRWTRRQLSQPRPKEAVNDRSAGPLGVSAPAGLFCSLGSNIAQAAEAAHNTPKNEIGSQFGTATIYPTVSVVNKNETGSQKPCIFAQFARAGRNQPDDIGPTRRSTRVPHSFFLITWSADGSSRYQTAAGSLGTPTLWNCVADASGRRHREPRYDPGGHQPGGPLARRTFLRLVPHLAH